MGKKPRDKQTHGRSINSSGCKFRRKTLPKAQRTRGLSSAYQSNFFRSYQKLFHKSWSKLSSIRISVSTVTTSKSFELASLHVRVTSIKSIKHHGVSEWQGSPIWSDSGPMKTRFFETCLPSSPVFPKGQELSPPQLSLVLSMITFVIGRLKDIYRQRCRHNICRCIGWADKSSMSEKPRSK